MLLIHYSLKLFLSLTVLGVLARIATALERIADEFAAKQSTSTASGLATNNVVAGTSSGATSGTLVSNLGTYQVSAPNLDPIPSTSSDYVNHGVLEMSDDSDG